MTTYFTNDIYYEPDSAQQKTRVALSVETGSSIAKGTEEVTDKSNTVWYLLRFQLAPSTLEFQRVINGGIKLVDGHYAQTYEVQDFSLEEAKSIRTEENNTKSEEARDCQAFTVTVSGTELSFISNRRTQSDLLTAALFLNQGASQYQWVDENGTVFVFTSASQVYAVAEKFMEKANVYPTWLSYKQQIDSATTVAQVRAIVIDYGINAQNLSAQILKD